jgi:hypothetical protein
MVLEFWTNDLVSFIIKIYPILIQHSLKNTARKEVGNGMRIWLFRETFRDVISNGLFLLVEHLIYSTNSLLASVISGVSSSGINSTVELCNPRF